MKIVQHITAEDRAKQLQPFINKFILVAGLLVSLLGVCGILGNLLSNNFLMSFTPPNNLATMSLPTAIAVVFLGVGIKTILDCQPYDEYPRWLWPVRYASILIPGSIGLWYVGLYLMDPRFDWLDLGTHGLFHMAFESSALLLLSTVALYLFLTRQRSERVVVYGVCLSAFLIFNVGILGVVGHIYHMPLLYAFQMAVPTALAGVLTGLALMMATLPFKGIWLPLLSPSLRARVMASLSGLFGFMVLLFGMNTIALSLRLSGFKYEETSNTELRHLLTGAVYACNLVAIVIKLIGLRASRYYSQSFQYAEKQAQAARELRLSRERFDLLVDSIQDYAIFTLDATGHIKSWGQGPERVLHYTKEEVLGQHFSMFLPEEEKELVKTELSLSKEHGYAEIEGWRLKKGHIRFWALVSSTALRDEQGNLLGFIKLIRDTTKRKQLEDALKDSEERFRSLADQAPMQVFMVDAAGHVTYFNKYWIEFTGFTIDELLGRGWEQVVHPDDVETLLIGYLKSCQKRQNYTLEARVKRWDGEYRHFLFTGGPRYFANGEFAGCVGTGIDISERKHFEAALRESEARLRWIVEADIVGVIFWTLDGQITGANNAFLEMLGYTRADLEAGRLNWRSLTPQAYGGLDDGFINDLRIKGQMEPCEKQCLTKDRHTVDILIAGALMEGSTNEGVAFVVDITKRKQAEAALRESQRQLAESNRDLEQFATVASHDLQAPLRKVRIFYDMIYDNAKDRLDPETLSLIERSQRSLDSMQNLITDLLALSKATKGGRPLRKVEVSKVVYRVLINLDDQIREKRAKVTIESSDTILADEVQLEQLLQNLISNGLKYQPPGQEPEIQIRTECLPGEGMCQIIVQDNGIGIPTEYWERIFEPFERLHGKTSKYEGTGVGLAICKRIVERHGGLILVDSIPGQGSRFVIKLPTHPVEESLRQSNPSSTAQKA